VSKIRAFLTLRLEALLEAVRLPDQKVLAKQQRFAQEKEAWVRAGGRVDNLWAITEDYDDNAGVAEGHYFHQDLLVAQFVHEASPPRHLDVGSSIAGFVAHVASFREIDIVDIRKLPETNHPNIQFIQADIQSSSLEGEWDSVSCLHTLEHFGLGRYSDPIDPSGHLAGLSNLIDLCSPGGKLYLSFPIASVARVDFNAHRVFHPEEPLSWAPKELELIRFDYVNDGGDLVKNAKISGIPPLIYGCGVYTFTRL